MKMTNTDERKRKTRRHEGARHEFPHALEMEGRRKKWRQLARLF